MFYMEAEGVVESEIAVAPETEHLSEFDKAAKDLRERLEDRELVKHQKDADIVNVFLGKLESHYNTFEFRQDEVIKAVEALDFLVPMRNERGFRQIGDITVSPR